MPGGPQCEKGTGMARSVAAKVAPETALPPPSGRVSTVWGARGGLSVGGTLGASDDGAVPCRGDLGAGTELAGHGTPVWPELEERSDDCEAGRAIWPEKTHAAGHACDWNRRGESAQRPDLSHGGLRFGTPRVGVGGGGSDRRSCAEVFHRRNGGCAVPRSRWLAWTCGRRTPSWSGNTPRMHRSCSTGFTSSSTS